METDDLGAAHKTDRERILERPKLPLRQGMVVESSLVRRRKQSLIEIWPIEMPEEHGKSETVLSVGHEKNSVRDTLEREHSHCIASPDRWT
jgi:hypothetical protein